MYAITIREVPARNCSRSWPVRSAKKIFTGLTPTLPRRGPRNRSDFQLPMRRTKGVDEAIHICRMHHPDHGPILATILNRCIVHFVLRSKIRSGLTLLRITSYTIVHLSIMLYFLANKGASKPLSKKSLSFSQPFKIKSLPVDNPALIASGEATHGPFCGRLLYHPMR